MELSHFRQDRVNRSLADCPKTPKLVWPQIGKITYVYYTLKKTLYSAGRFVSAQQGVNFCDDADAAVLAAKNFALSGSSSDDPTDTLLPALTADMITVSIERYDPESGVPVACDCAVAGCDAANGGGSPDFVVVSIPNVRYGMPVELP